MLHYTSSDIHCNIHIIIIIIIITLIISKSENLKIYNRLCVCLYSGVYSGGVIVLLCCHVQSVLIAQPVSLGTMSLLAPHIHRFNPR